MIAVLWASIATVCWSSCDQTGDYYPGLELYFGSFSYSLKTVFQIVITHICAAARNAHSRIQ